MKNISLTLPDDMAQKLAFHSERARQSEVNFLLSAIYEHLEDLEDATIAQERLAELKAGKSQIISHEEMVKNLGLDD